MNSKKKRIISTKEYSTSTKDIIRLGYTLDEVYDLYIKDCEARGLRPETLRQYHYCMVSFYKFIPHKTLIAEITLDTLQEYQTFCKDIRGNKPRTVYSNMKGIRSFLYWAMSNNYMNSYKIKLPKSEAVPLDMYTQEEITALLKEPIISEIRFSMYMTWVATNIFVFTGCRARTIIDIRIGDVDLENQLLFFRHTKNGKPHVVPLPTHLLPIVKKYIKIRLQNEEQDIDINELPLLCNAYGEQLTVKKLDKYFREYNNSRGVTRTGMHSFRRFYIKSLVLQGVPIPKIMHLVQHSTPNLIAHYSKMYPRDLTADVEEFANSIKQVKGTRLRTKIK